MEENKEEQVVLEKNTFWNLLKKALIHLVFLVISMISAINNSQDIILYFDELAYDEVMISVMLIIIAFFELEILYHTFKWIRNKKITLLSFLFVVLAIMFIIGTCFINVGQENYYSSWSGYKGEIFYNIYRDTLYTEQEKLDHQTDSIRPIFDRFDAPEQIEEELVDGPEYRILKKASIFILILIIFDLFELVFSKNKKRFNYILLIVLMICFGICYFKPVASFEYSYANLNWYNGIIVSSNSDREIVSIKYLARAIWILMNVMLIKLIVSNKNRLPYFMLVIASIFVLFLVNDQKVRRIEREDFYKNVYDVVILEEFIKIKQEIDWYF